MKEGQIIENILEQEQALAVRNNDNSRAGILDTTITVDSNVQAVLDRWLLLNPKLNVNIDLIKLAQSMLESDDNVFLHWEILKRFGWEIVYIKDKANSKEILNTYFIFPHKAKSFRKNFNMTYTRSFFESFRLVFQEDYLDDGLDGKKTNLKNYIFKNGPSSPTEMIMLYSWWEQKNEYNSIQRN